MPQWYVPNWGLSIERRQWGWLFPACVLAGSTVTILLSQIKDIQGTWLGVPMFLSLGIPFLVAYFLEREKNQWALIPAYAMVALSVEEFMVNHIRGELLGTLVLLLIALPFLYLFLRRE
jgi:hypothetical protein